MRRVLRKATKNQPPATPMQQAISLDDGTVTTPAALARIRALIPLGLRAVEAALVAEVTALAGPRYARDDDRSAVVRWGAQPGSIYLADQNSARRPCGRPNGSFGVSRITSISPCSSRPFGAHFHRRSPPRRKPHHSGTA